MTNTIRLWLAAVLTLSIGACTTVPEDNGISSVQDLLDENPGPHDVQSVIDPEDPMSPEEITQILSAPLGIGDAERMSLEVNPESKATLLRVGIAEADYAQAGRMENPGFSLERFSGEDYSASLLFDIGGLLLMPLRRQVEARRLEMARYEAAAAVLDHIVSTRRAWINAVAQRQQTGLMQRAVESAQTGNNMIRQMTALGHSNIIESAESEILLHQLQASLARQRLTELTAKETLIRQLGLWGKHARMIELPDRLPELPEILVDFEAVEREAVQNRLDVQVVRLNLERMAKNLGLTRLNPFLSSIELGPKQESVEGFKEDGYELELRIPIFDAGGVQDRKAKIVFDQAQAQAEAVAITAASESRQALVAYQTTWEVARHFGSKVMPLRQRVSQERLLMYNGMLMSVFDLLADVRSAAIMESNYVNAVRDFWLADANLQSAMTGTAGTPMRFDNAMVSPDAGGGGGH